MSGGSEVSPRPAEEVWYFDLSPVQAGAEALAGDRPVASLLAEERQLPRPDECEFLQRVGKWLLTPAETGPASCEPSWSHVCGGVPGTRAECSKCPAFEPSGEAES